MVDQTPVAEDPDRPEKPESRQKLSRRQLELVLRRAAELERNEADGDELVSAEEVERLGLEAGLSPESLERALVEVRTGPWWPRQPRQGWWTAPSGRRAWSSSAACPGRWARCASAWSGSCAIS